jgi:chromosome segregation ATPase
MQLVVVRVVAAAAVASEASARTSLEAARQSAEDRATTAQTAAIAVGTERDSLASRLALAEAEVEKLRVAAVSAEEAAERAKTAATATKTVARDAAQATAREKVTLKARVSGLERDLSMATTDLATAGRLFSQVTNQLQVVSEEATQLRESNAKLSQDLEGESRARCLSLFHSPLASCHVRIAGRGRRGARDPCRDDHQVGGGEGGAKLRPSQGQQEGRHHQALVGATSE